MAEVELTVTQAAQELGVAARTVREWLRQGRLRGRRVRGRRGMEWRVYSESLGAAKGDDAAQRGGGGTNDAAQDGTEGGTAHAALVSEVRSLREEVAAYKEVLELFAGRLGEMQATMQRLLPPAEEPQRRPWWRFWR